MAKASAEHLDTLMCAVQDGDQDAFRDLVAAAQVPLRSFLALRLVHLEHLDEVEQATWVTCYQKRDVYRPGSRFLPWVMGIAKNLAAQHMRQVYRHRQHDDEIMDLLLDEEANSESLDPDTAMLRRETTGLVQDCVKKLAPMARRLVEARYFQEKSVAEIAETEGRTGNWVSVNLMRIRQNLGNCLKAQGLDT